jgi:pyruvate dehydrogenase E2 component (dihydrolipoamide acetyltransferase)
MGVLELARSRRELVDHALAGTTTLEELSGGTFTLSNLGALGVDNFTPILNSPQVAVLGAGRIRPAPAVHKGKLRIRQLLGLSLTCDHRVIDGAPAARFLQEVTSLIENPDLIWL